jgi:hypothetical protein
MDPDAADGQQDRGDARFDFMVGEGGGPDLRGSREKILRRERNPSRAQRSVQHEFWVRSGVILPRASFNRVDHPSRIERPKRDILRALPPSYRPYPREKGPRNKTALVPSNMGSAERVPQSRLALGICRATFAR